MNIVGIYKIINPKGKTYIGQSINIHKRLKVYNHLNKVGIGPKLYNSLVKYGFDNHISEIIEECCIEQLNEREIYWKQHELNKVDNDFSKVLFCELYDKSGGPRNEITKQKISQKKLGQKHLEKTKCKISEAKKGKPSHRKGKKMSEESKQKISENNKGKTPWNKGITHSDKTKQQMSEYWKGKRIGCDHPRAKAVIDLETGIEYPSLSACIKGINKARDTVYKYIEIGKLKYK